MGTTLDFTEQATREVRHWPGVSIARVERGKKHNRLHLSYRDKTRFVVFPSSCGDFRGVKNHISAIRHTLIGLGATRSVARGGDRRQSVEG